MNRAERRAAERKLLGKQKPIDQAVVLAELSWHYFRSFGVTDMRLALPTVQQAMQKEDGRARNETAQRAAGAAVDQRYNFLPGTGFRIYSTFLHLGHVSLSTGFWLPVHALWYAEAMPTIEIGHKLAASLMVTTIGPQVLEHLELPFHSFLVRMPEGLVHMHSMEGKEVDIQYLRLAHLQDSAGTPVWAFYAECAGNTTLMFGHHKGIAELYDNMQSIDCDGYPLDTTLDTVDKRASRLCRRLLLNICLMMTEGSYTKRTRGVPGAKRVPREGPPEQLLFRLTQPVTHDFRSVVSEYCGTGGGKLNIQCIVSGHWKMQVHGPGRAQRKRLFIEPYWRGPEDAPIALRPHKLGE